MSSEATTGAHSPSATPIPAILVRSASPQQPQETSVEPPSSKPPTYRHQSSTLQVPPRQGQKRSASEASLDTDTQGTMAPPSSKKESESSSKKHKSSSSSSKSKSKQQKTDDWTEVSEPEERRRIQNRIAQRKFREKTRENKERAERDNRNQQHAASCYQIPSPNDVPLDHEVAGLPWGTFSMRHVVSRGHEAESRRSSGRGEYIREDARYQPGPYKESHPHASGVYQQHPGSFASSSTGEEGYYETDPQLIYDYDTSGAFIGDQFSSVAWPESPAFAPALPPMGLPNHENDTVYY